MRGPVGEVQVPVVVDVTDIAERAPPPVVVGVRRLHRIVVIFEPEVGVEPDLAGLTGGEFPAVVIADVERAENRHPDGSRVGEPLFGSDRAEPVALTSGVVLVDDRPPPVEHLALHLDRTRRRRMNDHLQARQIVRRAFVLAQLEHPHEMGRHELGVGDPVLLDQFEAALRVELLHQHDGGAEPLSSRRPAERRRVVERRRAQVHGLVREAVHLLDQRNQVAAAGTEGLGLNHRFDSLGPAGGTRGVEHERALDLVVEALGRVLRDFVLVAVVPVGRAVHHQADADLGEVWLQFAGDVGQCHGCEQRCGATVPNDVAGLFGLEMPVDRRGVQTSALRAPEHLEVAGVVLEHHPDVVTRL